MSSSNFPHLVQANSSSMENTRPTSTWIWTDTEVDIALLPPLRAWQVDPYSGGRTGVFAGGA